MICVNSVSVSPKTITLKKGAWSYNARATVSPANADCKNVTWHSNKTSVATVNASSGYIYGKGVGTAKIYATATDGSGCRDYLTVTVTNTVAVTSVTLNRSNLSLEAGQCTELYATVCPQNATNKKVNWTSSNTSVATVSGGVVTAVSKGSARITATAADGSGCSAFCSVQVTEDVLVTSVSISPSTKTMIAGKSAYFYATVCPNDASNRGVTWSSDDPSIATVNPNSGLVYAQKHGTTVIRATACDGSGVFGSCTITVQSPIQVQCITISPQCKEMEGGEIIQFEASISPNDAENKNIRWYSMNPEIAEVNSCGLVFAKKIGITTIYAFAKDGSGVVGCSQVTVRSNLVPIDDITLSPQITTLSGGEFFSPLATICPTNATIQELDWRSEAPDVAEVDSNGVVLAKKRGTTVIWAIAKDYSGICACCSVTVLSDLIEVESIVMPSETLSLNVDETVILTATVSPKTATIQSVKWVSADPNIAVVDEVTGAVTAKASGVTMIYAQAMDGSGQKGECLVTVNKYPLWTCYQTNNDCYKAGKSIGKVQGIVVHSTGASNTNVKRYVDYPEKLGINAYGNHWNKSGVNKMVHAFVGHDKNKNVCIVNTLPYEYRCWGVGSGTLGSYNNSHIQFEVCEDNLENSNYYNEAVLGAAVQYCAYLCKAFNLPVSSIVSHHEAHLAGYGSNHGDIDHWLASFGHTMNDFRSAVNDELELQKIKS